MADKTAGPNSMMALIIPISSSSAGPKPQPPGGGGGAPDQTLPGDLPKPSHPIYYPLPPGAPVHPDQGLPGEQPYPDQGLPGSQPHPDQGLPPGQGGAPTHPIVLPPDATGGWGPIYIWGGGPGARPPIALPPDGEAPPEAGGKIKWKAVWSPSNGWQTIGVVVPEGSHPAPSKK